MVSKRSWVRRRLWSRLAITVDHLPEGLARGLDYGCGTRPYQSLLEAAVSEYVPVDVGGNRCAKVWVDPQFRLPFEDGTFDLVLSSQVLEHVTSPVGYLSAVYQVLKPGGVAVVSTHGTWPFHPHPEDLWRWTPDGLSVVAKTVGFQIVGIRHVLSMPAVALLLWQDATAELLPRPLRWIYVWSLQALMAMCDVARDMLKGAEVLDPNGGVFIASLRVPTGEGSNEL